MPNEFDRSTDPVVRHVIKGQENLLKIIQEFYPTGVIPTSLARIYAVAFIGVSLGISMVERSLPDSPPEEKQNANECIDEYNNLLEADQAGNLTPLSDHLRKNIKDLLDDSEHLSDGNIERRVKGVKQQTEASFWANFADSL